ncbi:MAG: hypothetical protein Q7S16_01925 [bacterium]|nr:hypothetical protein [bacterium]
MGEIIREEPKGLEHGDANEKIFKEDGRSVGAYIKDAMQDIADSLDGTESHKWKDEEIERVRKLAYVMRLDVDTATTLLSRLIKEKENPNLLEDITEFLRNHGKQYGEQ